MKRLKKETFENYQKRRKEIQSEITTKLKRPRILYNGFGPYVKKQSSESWSFTKSLRNKKGYAEHLKLKFSK